MNRVRRKLAKLLVRPVKVLHHRQTTSTSGLVRACKDVAAAVELLRPYDARLMRCYPVSTRINRVANDEECSAPVELAQIQDRLFS